MHIFTEYVAKYLCLKMLIFGLSWLEHSPSIMSIVFIKKKYATALQQHCCFFPFNTSMRQTLVGTNAGQAYVPSAGMKGNIVSLSIHIILWCHLVLGLKWKDKIASFPDRHLSWHVIVLTIIWFCRHLSKQGFSRLVDWYLSDRKLPWLAFVSTMICPGFILGIVWPVTVQPAFVH